MLTDSQFHLFLSYVAYPTRTKETQAIPVTKGSNVTLPCNVERPFINQYTVTWTVLGSDKKIRLSPGQYDLELTNINSFNTEYTCHVKTSIGQPESGADAIAAITLTFTPQHSKYIDYPW